MIDCPNETESAHWLAVFAVVKRVLFLRVSLPVFNAFHH
jgi:hypothetical protein